MQEAEKQSAKSLIKQGKFKQAFQTFKIDPWSFSEWELPTNNKPTETDSNIKCKSGTINMSETQEWGMIPAIWTMECMI